MIAERTGDLAGKTAADELLRGQIHAHAESRVATPSPTRSLATRLVEHVSTERKNEAGLLGKADEVAGQHETPLRVLPAKESLDTDDVARAERDDGLVVDDELVGDDGALEIRLERKPLQHVLVHRRLVHGVPPLPLALRPVHREIRASHDLVRRLRPSVEGDPDARLRGHVGALDDERLGHRREDPVRHGHGALGRRDVLDHHGELVAAEPRTRVLGSNRRAKPLRDDHEKLVADTVSEAVVHRLEVVQVDEEHGEEVLTPRSSLDGVRDSLGEERAVGETRERIVERLIRELNLERPALSDIARGENDTADVRGVEKVVEHALELHDRAVLPAETEITGHRSAHRRAHVSEEPAEPLGVVFGEELREAPADELVFAVAENPLDGGGVVANREVGREEDDDVARALHERTKALGTLALVQILGEVGALERQRHLARERLDTVARLLGQLLARVEDECCILTGQRKRHVRADATCTRVDTRPRDRDAVDGELDDSVLASGDLARGVDRNEVDVVTRPRRDESGGGLSECVLASLRAFVPRDEAGQPGHHENRQRRAGPDDDEELARPVPDRRDREHRWCGQCGSREDSQAHAGQPLLRIRIRLRELDHRRMQRRSAPENRGEDEEEIDRVADAVPTVERSESVQRVSRELEDEREGDHRERGRSKTRSQHHACREGHEEDVQHREGQSDRRAERARVVGEGRVHDERPSDDGDADRDDGRIDEARPVATGDLLADHHEQRGRENDVRAEREVVGCRRERDLTYLLELDRIQRVGGDGAEPAARHEVPRQPRPRLVERHADERRDDGGHREELVPAVVVRGLVRQGDVRERAGRGNEEERAVGARDAHEVPIGTA